MGCVFGDGKTISYKNNLAEIATYKYPELSTLPRFRGISSYKRIFSPDREPLLDGPKFSGAVPKFEPQDPQHKKSDGVMYGVTLLWKCALFPTENNSLSIKCRRFNITRILEPV